MDWFRTVTTKDTKSTKIGFDETRVIERMHQRKIRKQPATKLKLLHRDLILFSSDRRFGL
ncbi:hypothetical protein A6X21_21230 [Planctopirus hydrillae]|uniref:Uncharacterized protein n=1 Tax=Planctopirus hydrillae TaxID=1841610 RepID=A0A1C3EFR5_9PLAN|nr:hypothetical protein A6X21_21230 [Planctopirus hydrillae]